MYNNKYNNNTMYVLVGEEKNLCEYKLLFNNEKI